MTNTALIGSSCALGNIWASKRFYDYLFDPDNWDLLRNKQFGELVLIDPALWEGPAAAAAEPEKYAILTDKLIHRLHEAKIERLTYITTLDLLPQDGNEDSVQLKESPDPYLNDRIKLRDFVNLQFGRVLTIRLPEIIGLGKGFSVLDELDSDKSKLNVSLLERHQFYPISRIVKDVETAWSCGIFSAILVSEPITTFELVEKVTPHLQDKLPVAHESDPVGSNRSSKIAFMWHDPMTGHILEKDDMIALIRASLEQEQQ